MPHSLRAKVEAEIKRLVNSGVLEPVKFSEWAAPVVPVVKQDGTVELCGDFKATVNKATLTDTYLLPRIAPTFAVLLKPLVLISLG